MTAVSDIQAVSLIPGYCFCGFCINIQITSYSCSGFTLKLSLAVLTTAAVAALKPASVVIYGISVYFVNCAETAATYYGAIFRHQYCFFHSISSTT